MASQHLRPSTKLVVLQRTLIQTHIVQPVPALHISTNTTFSLVFVVFMIQFIVVYLLNEFIYY